MAAKNFEIAIIGGGIAGITLAIALHERNIPVKIYEGAHVFGEIGAGVSFSPNAVEAMKICHGGVYDAFNKVATRNVWPSKEKVWFDYLNGYDEGDTYAFTISNSVGQNGVHRAHFLSEMIHLIPEGMAEFGKRLLTTTKQSNGKMLMKFADGTSAEADAVIGCDGIKSRVRASMFGENHPCAEPGYTHKYAYRGLVPMEDAIAVLGEERAQNSCMHMGPGGHILTFPVNHGDTLNIVAFKTDDGEWPDSHKLTRPAERKDLLRDFENWSKDIVNLLNLTEPNLDIWAIFDLLDNPPPAYAKGAVCIIGDAAHATSPHHGSGAGLCIEDAAILSQLIADPRVTDASALEVVFATFNEQRKERGEFLMSSSRFSGRSYEWQNDYGRDFKHIEAESNRRNTIIGEASVAKLYEEASAELTKRLSAQS